MFKIRFKTANIKLVASAVFFNVQIRYVNTGASNNNSVGGFAACRCSYNNNNKNHRTTGSPLNVLNNQFLSFNPRSRWVNVQRFDR